METIFYKEIKGKEAMQKKMEQPESTQLYNSSNHFIDMSEIDDDSIIIDAGACGGGFIQGLREHERGKNCRVIAIECDKDNIEKLRERNFLNVTICEKALVGQKSCDRPIFYHIVGYPDWGNFYKRTPGDDIKIKKYKVKTLRINDIFSVFDIERIDFLKMDIEGSEGDILKTMTEETATKIGQMSIEVHDWQDFLSVSDAMEILDDLGFNTFRMGKAKKEVFGKRERWKNDE